MAWMVMPSFSAMPLVMRLPFVVIWLEMELEGASKKGISWRSVCRTKSTRIFLTTRIEVMETATWNVSKGHVREYSLLTVQMYVKTNFPIKR